MPPRSRTTTDDLPRVSIPSLHRSGKLRLGRSTTGFLLDKESPRFFAFLGHNGIGWIEVGSQRWSVEGRNLRHGGFRLYCRGGNGRCHLNLFITGDGRVGTASELGLTWATKRLSKTNRALYRRRK